jgi:hypothetical protein
MAGLAGQLASVADALFVEHVTCLAHGDRIHVVSDAPVVATRWDLLGAPAVHGDEHDHVQCLLDDDIDFVPGATPASLPAPIVVDAPRALFDSITPVIGRSPLYRLAPKNSPPI